MIRKIEDVFFILTVQRTKYTLIFYSRYASMNHSEYTVDLLQICKNPVRLGCSAKHKLSKKKLLLHSTCQKYRPTAFFYFVVSIGFVLYFFR